MEAALATAAWETGTAPWETETASSSDDDSPSSACSGSITASSAAAAAAASAGEEVASGLAFFGDAAFAPFEAELADGDFPLFAAAALPFLLSFPILSRALATAFVRLIQARDFYNRRDAASVADDIKVIYPRADILN